jgi:hypothetical protein
VLCSCSVANIRLGSKGFPGANTLKFDTDDNRKLIPTFYTTFISVDNNVGFDVVTKFFPSSLTTRGSKLERYSKASLSGLVPMF